MQIRAMQIRAMQIRVLQMRSALVNSGSILGKGLDYWDVALWCQRSMGKGLGFVAQFDPLNKVTISLKSTVPTLRVYQIGHIGC